MLPPQADVLDAGCGPGLQSEILNKLGCSCTGIDVSEEMVAAAQRRVPEGTFRVASFLDLGKLSSKFDGILFSYSLLHVGREEAGKVLNTCRDLLRKDGLLALFLREGEGEHFIDAPLMTGTRLFTRLWTEGEILALLRELGFSVEFSALAWPESVAEFQYRKLFILSKLRLGSTLFEKLRRVKAVLLDVDGTMTDGLKFYSARGLETLAFDARDGLGIALMQAAGVQVALVSNGPSEIVNSRGKDLGVAAILSNVDDKSSALSALTVKLGVDETETVFVGDDLWDLSAFSRSAVRIAVADAVPAVRAAADHVLTSKGGRGAIRELADMLLEAKGLDASKLLAEL